MYFIIVHHVQHTHHEKFKILTRKDVQELKVRLFVSLHPRYRTWNHLSILLWNNPSILSLELLSILSWDHPLIVLSLGPPLHIELGTTPPYWVETIPSILSWGHPLHTELRPPPPYWAGYIPPPMWAGSVSLLCSWICLPSYAAGSVSLLCEFGLSLLLCELGLSLLPMQPDLSPSYASWVCPSLMWVGSVSFLYVIGRFRTVNWIFKYSKYDSNYHCFCFFRIDTSEAFMDWNFYKFSIRFVLPFLLQ